MKKLKLNDEYYWYNNTEYINIPDEVAEVFADFMRTEHRHFDIIKRSTLLTRVTELIKIYFSFHSYGTNCMRRN